jgi:hypothetical protein
MLQHPNTCLQRYNITALVYNRSSWVSYHLQHGSAAYAEYPPTRGFTPWGISGVGTTLSFSHMYLLL